MRALITGLVCAWALAANAESAEAACRGPACGKRIAHSLKMQWRANLSARLLNCTIGADVAPAQPAKSRGEGLCQRGSLKLTGAEWAFLSKTFLKCTRWQVEETTDPLNCPYHYYCNSRYPGNYPVAADWLALALWALCGLLLAGALLWEFAGRGFDRSAVRYYCLPSGPAVLPLVLLALAKGPRIDSLFPLSYAAPALLQLLHISALGAAAAAAASKNLNSVVFHVSSASGILHASLYVDSVALPYYTGLEAFVFSSTSGICRSCVCRKEPLVAGGRFLAEGGWSRGSLVVAAALLCRLACGLRRQKHPRRRALDLAGAGLECLAWGFAIRDVTALARNPPLAQRGLSYDRGLVRPLLALLVLALSKRFWNLWGALKAGRENNPPRRDRGFEPSTRC